VAILNAFVLTFFLALPVPATPPIEKAFLQNSADALAELLTSRGDIPVSLPDPLSLADVLSPDQAYLVFRRVFATFKTTEFFVTPGLATLPGRPGGILRARWSFRSERTGRTTPVRVFFYLSPEPPGGGRILKVVEIRGERL